MTARLHDPPPKIFAMSLIRRLFGKTPHASPAPAIRPADPAAPAKPRPDTAGQARDEEARVSQAISAGDAAAIARWVLEGSSTRIRQMAAQAVTDPEQLRELIRATRGGNDKSVYRILTTRRDLLLAEDRARQQRKAEVDAAAAAIARLSERPYDALYEATLTQLEVRWQAAAEHADPEMQGTVTAQLARARGVIEQHREALRAEGERQRTAMLEADAARRARDLQAEASAAAAAEEARIAQAAREAERAKREAEDAEVRHLLGLLRQAQSAIDHGGTARAARLRDTIQEKQAQVPALPPWFGRKLQELDTRIEEMKDWKTFTVVPKRAELLQRMQALIGADMAPEELARQIRRLRDEWRTLGRGAAEDPSPEWQQFNDLAERAYEPCREHFARQAERRMENQARRESLLERLAAFAAAQTGEDVDWRSVQQVIAEARREWQQYAPVDQAIAKSLQERFHAQLDELHTRLGAEYERNVEAKRRLIERAAGLAEVADTRQAIDEAKNLQRIWKSVGVVPRQQDHALWEGFRRNCDAVFQRSSQEFAAQHAALEANHARAIELCEELERMAGLEGEPLVEGMRRLKAVREEFDSLELPRASARELRQRFSAAGNRCADAARAHRAAEARRGWDDLFAAAARVRAYALAVTEGRAADESAALQSVAAAAVAALEHAPPGSRAILERQMSRIAAGGFSADVDANEAALRMLCIRAELIAGVDTPAEDLERRREYQMQRLVQTLQRGERVSPAEIDDLAMEWIAVGPVPDALHDRLFARFERCRVQ